MAKLTASDAARLLRLLRGDRRRHHRGRGLRRRRRRLWSGSVYVFRTSDGGATYDQVAKLTAADAAAYDYFGDSVAIDGTPSWSGPTATTTAVPARAAYVFRTTDGGATYGQVAKLTVAEAWATTGSRCDTATPSFGWSVAIDGRRRRHVVGWPRRQATTRRTTGPIRGHRRGHHRGQCRPPSYCHDRRRRHVRPGGLRLPHERRRAPRTARWPS